MRGAGADAGVGGGDESMRHPLTRSNRAHWQVRFAEVGIDGAQSSNFIDGLPRPYLPRGLPAIQSALTYLERIASDNLCIDSHNNPSKVDAACLWA